MDLVTCKWPPHPKNRSQQALTHWLLLWSIRTALLSVQTSLPLTLLSRLRYLPDRIWLASVTWVCFEVFDKITSWLLNTSEFITFHTDSSLKVLNFFNDLISDLSAESSSLALSTAVQLLQGFPRASWGSTLTLTESIQPRSNFKTAAFWGKICIKCAKPQNSQWKTHSWD